MTSNSPTIARGVRPRHQLSTYRSPAAAAAFGATTGASLHRHHTCTNSVADNEKMQKNEDWVKVQGAIVGFFQKKKIAENQLGQLRQNVKNLLDSKIGTFLFDFYMKQALTRGMTVLREQIRSCKDNDQMKYLNDAWLHFYTEVIPNVQAIFYPFKPKHLSIRQTCLVYFRDVVLLNLPIADSLHDLKKQAQGTIPGIQHMLLMLQSVHDSFPPNNNRLVLEKMVAAVVIPYLGFQGLYEGGTEPVIRSKEPTIIKKKCTHDCTARLSRHYNCQTFTNISTLEDMFHSAYSRKLHERDDS